jgi:hypothetical protein
MKAQREEAEAHLFESQYSQKFLEKEETKLREKFKNVSSRRTRDTFHI